MYYSVKCDENYIYHPQRGYVLIDPKLEMEDNSAGSFEFTMAPDHPFFDSVNLITSTITVYRDGVEIWSGRPVEEREDFYKRKYVYCEGELAYLNDSIQPQAEFHDYSVRQWLTAVINEHNNQVDAGKQFTVGSVTVEDNLYRYTNFENTLEAIGDKLIDRLGGHLRIRKQNGVRYLDYLKDYPKSSAQEIKFGRNILDYSRNYDISDIATVIIPLGARLDESPIEALDAYVTVESVNAGSKYVRNETAIQNFGWICQTVHWDDVTEPANLLRKAQDYLTAIQYDQMQLDINAIDFNLVDSDQPALDMLDEVRVISEPHGLDKWFPVTAQSIPLADPANTVYTLGVLTTKTMTAKTNADIQAIKDAIENIPTKSAILEQAQENATQLIISGALGSHVVVKPDEIYVMDTDDEKTARRVWRWNVNGLGYSSTGVSGNFGLAMTIDGRIVADYITAGTLSCDRLRGGTIRLGGSSYGNGAISMYDGTGALIGWWNSSGFMIQKGDINLDTSSHIRIPVNSSGSSYLSLDKNGFNLVYENGKLETVNTQKSGQTNWPQRVPITSLRAIYSNNSSQWYGEYNCCGFYALRSPKNGGLANESVELSVDRLRIAKYNSSGATVVGLSVDLQSNSSNVAGQFTVSGFTQIFGDFIVTGSKSRVVETEDYGNRLLYAYETPSPYFGDIGEGTISDDGKCYVWIDSIFAETVSLNQYQVFLQKYGQGDCWVSERKPGYFVVEGTPGLSFGCCSI